MRNGWKGSKGSENRAVRCRALAGAHARGASPVRTQLPWRGSGGGARPGERTSGWGLVRERLWRERCCFGTSRPLLAQLHDVLCAGGLGMPFRSYLSLAVGGLVFLQVLITFSSAVFLLV